MKRDGASGLVVLLAILLSACATSQPVLLNSDILAVEETVAGWTRANLGAETAGQHFDHSAWSNILRHAVKPDGTIDYAALKYHEQAINAYLVEAGNVQFESLSRHEQLALLLNVYNACTVKMILENPGLRSVTTIPAARGWRQVGWVINRKGVSLEQLERDYIRRQFPDPRTHFALVRGARGSPPLRAEPYTGPRLNAQLDDQARRVVGDSRFVAWDSEKNLLRLGGLFGRYRRDFADDDAGLVRALMPWMPDSLRNELIARGRIELEFEPFDWRLNGTW